jgi:hypothetical protein
MNRLFYFIVFGLLPLIGLGQPQGPDTLWTRLYLHSDYQAPTGFVQNLDGGYTLVGSWWNESSTLSHICALRVDESGDTLWWRRYFGEDESSHSLGITGTTDGGFVFCGSYHDSLQVMKVDAQGSLLWYRTLRRGEANHVTALTDGTFLTLGTSYDPYLSACLVKWSADGDTLWSHTYGGRLREVIHGLDLHVLPDGGLMILAQYIDLHTPPDPRTAWLIRTESDGDTLWIRRYGPQDSTSLWSPHAVCPAGAGGFYLVGEELDTLNEFSIVRLMRLDDNGELVWSRLYPESESWEKPTDIFPAPSGDCIVVGNNRHRYTASVGGCLRRVSMSGDVQWRSEYNRYDDCGLGAAIPTYDGGYALAGQWGTGIYPTLFYLVKTGPDPLGVGGERPQLQPTADALEPCYPNPFNATMVITFRLARRQAAVLSLYDLHGRTLATITEGTLDVGGYTIHPDFSFLPTGVYFLTLKTDHALFSQKLFLIR